MSASPARQAPPHPIIARPVHTALWEWRLRSGLRAMLRQPSGRLGPTGARVPGPPPEPPPPPAPPTANRPGPAPPVPPASPAGAPGPAPPAPVSPEAPGPAPVEAGPPAVPAFPLAFLPAP